MNKKIRQLKADDDQEASLKKKARVEKASKGIKKVAKKREQKQTTILAKQEGREGRP